MFSHCEGETIDESAAADAIAKPSSNPIGTGLRPATPTNQQTFEISSTSPGSLSPSPNKIKELDGPSVTSLPDRIACEGFYQISISVFKPLLSSYSGGDDERGAVGL